MTKLFVYGDSYSTDKAQASWAVILKNLLNFEMINRAVGGASTENAMIEFEKSIKNNEINDGDIIILQLSTPGRLYLEYQRTDPSTASIFLHDEVNSDHTYYDWWKRNKDYIKWYLLNYDNYINIINRESYIHVLKNYAESYPNRIIMILQNGLQDVKFPITNIPSNFLLPNFDLNKISENEIVNFTTYNDWVKYTMYDYRDNHLCIPNLEILANTIYESLQTRKIDNFRNDKFNSNIVNRIENLNDYLDFVNKGYIIDIDWKKNNIIKKTKNNFFSL